jgi:hypothetical protein
MPESEPLAGVGARLRRTISAHFGSRDVARVIYGAVIGLALLVALEDHPPSTAQAVTAVVGTAVAVGLAEIYSELVSVEARTRRPVRADQVRTAALDAAAVMFGAGFPTLFFLVAALGVIDLPQAFTLSKWTGLALLCTYGYVAGRLAGAGLGVALLHSAAVGAIGGVLIAVKALLH